MKGCGNDPRTKLTIGDHEAIQDFMRYLKSKVAIGPKLQCACGYECVWSDQFERHELSPDIWQWFCWSCVETLELASGK